MNTTKKKGIKDTNIAFKIEAIKKLAVKGKKTAKGKKTSSLFSSIDDSPHKDEGIQMAAIEKVDAIKKIVKKTESSVSPIKEFQDSNISLLDESLPQDIPNSFQKEESESEEGVRQELPAEESAEKSKSEESSEKSKSEESVEKSEESAEKSEESSEEGVVQGAIAPAEESAKKIELMPLKTNIEKYNQFLLNKERKEHESYKTYTDNLLYPTLDDPDFAYKISKRQEFVDTPYDGTISNIEEKANQLCHVSFEIAPHQLFVKNFLSAETPYNSLLLYHGLGSGKTCSAIGITEEMRAYMKQLGLTKKIIIVASPNVQDNFRLQLFDERRLELLENGQWNLNTCVGPALLKEINPNNLQGLSRERIISQIKTIIQSYYVFMGDKGKFANYIQKIIHIPEDSGYSEEEKKKIVIKRIKHYFNNRLVVIDEIHNMRIAESNKQKLTTILLNKVARLSDNMRLLLLSATPLYNSYDEIIWLTNLMNTNDKRGLIKTSDVFNMDGSFVDEVKDEKGNVIKESGRDLLKRKITGYISYVRGENPYIFPYRVYPKDFHSKRAIQSVPYPKRQMNQQPIQKENRIQHIPVYINRIGSYQGRAYDFIIQTLGLKSFSTTNAVGKKRAMPTFENMDGFGYNILLDPLEALIMVYPNPELDALLLEERVEEFNQERNSEIIKSMIGKSGLKHIMKSKSTYEPIPIRNGFEYLPKVLDTYGEIFSPDEIHKYSKKIANICEIIKRSKGIIMIYSQYIDGGIIPMALALESMGFSRYSSTPAHAKPLLKHSKEPIDSLTMKPRRESGGDFKPARYAIISGDKFFSYNNAEDIKYVTNRENANGEFCKVLLISKAASEGLDFKCIRQIHILEPWYNMNRVEQIIGRGVRNLSHCALPFRERNVEIYLHGTILKEEGKESEKEETEEEAADLYVYRSAEKKAMQIGQVTRILKENAVDCILNISQTNFTVKELDKIVENKGINLELSSGKLIPFSIGDKPFTEICDYMANCAFQCSIREEAKKSLEKGFPKNRTTYSTTFLRANSDLIMKKIRDLYKEHTVFKRENLVNEINRIKKYPEEHILYSLTRFVNNKNEEIIDQYGRSGYLVNRGKIYAFQPNEISDESASIYERTKPIDYKRVSLKMQLVKRHVDEMQPLRQEKGSSYENLLERLNDQIDIFHKEDLQITATDKNWYKYANIVSDVIRSIYDIPINLIKKYVIHHFLDLLSMFDKLVLIRRLFKKEGHIGLSDSEVICKLYFEENEMILEGIHAILLFDGEKTQLWTQSKENLELWTIAEYTDEELFKEEIDRIFTIPNERIHRKEVGFVYSFKGTQNVIKIKDMSQKRSVGAKLDDAGKPIVLKYLAGILGAENQYNEKLNEKYIKKNLSLCVILEILMRWMTENRRLTGEPLLFFNAETA